MLKNWGDVQSFWEKCLKQRRCSNVQMFIPAGSRNWLVIIDVDVDDVIKVAADDILVFSSDVDGGIAPSPVNKVIIDVDVDDVIKVAVDVNVVVRHAACACEKGKGMWNCGRK
eukprot:2701817-Amphidinium_carterae.1